MLTVGAICTGGMTPRTFATSGMGAASFGESGFGSGCDWATSRMGSGNGPEIGRADSGGTACTPIGWVCCGADVLLSADRTVRERGSRSALNEGGAAVLLSVGCVKVAAGASGEDALVSPMALSAAGFEHPASGWNAGSGTAGGRVAGCANNITMSPAWAAASGESVSTAGFTGSTTGAFCPDATADSAGSLVRCCNSESKLSPRSGAELAVLLGVGAVAAMGAAGSADGTMLFIRKWFLS